MQEFEIDDLEFFDDLEEVTPVVDDAAADDTADDNVEDVIDETADDKVVPPVIPPATPPAGTTDDDTEVFKSAFDLYKERGLITLPDDYKFEPTEEGFQKALDDSAEAFRNSVIEDLKTDLPAEGLALVKYMREGGKDISKFIQVYSKPDYSNMELSTDEDRKAVLTDYYKRTTKWSDERINKQLTNLDVTGDLEDEADTAKGELAALDEEEKQNLVKSAADQAAARKVAEQEAFNSLSKVLEESKDINGYPVSKTDVNTVIPFLLKPIKLKDGRITTAYNQKHNELMQNPKTAVLLAKLMASNLDLSVLSKKQETVTTKTVKQKLQSALNHKGSAGADNGNEDDWDEIL